MVVVMTPKGSSQKQSEQQIQMGCEYSVNVTKAGHPTTFKCMSELQYRQYNQERQEILDQKNAEFLKDFQGFITIAVPVMLVLYILRRFF